MISLKFKSHSIKLTLNQLLDEVLTKNFHKKKFCSKKCKFCRFQSTFETIVQKLSMIWVILRSHMINLILIQLLGLVLTLENHEFGRWTWKSDFCDFQSTFKPTVHKILKSEFFYGIQKSQNVLIQLLTPKIDWLW